MHSVLQIMLQCMFQVVPTPSGCVQGSCTLRGFSVHSFSSLKLAFHVTSATCMCRRSQSLPHDATEAGLGGLRS